jgi:hypothetical protein
MSDEQTRLLQQILEVQKEQLEFTKQHSQRALGLSELALARQQRSMRSARIILLIMLGVLGLLLAFSMLRPKRSELPPADQPNSENPISV